LLFKERTTLKSQSIATGSSEGCKKVSMLKTQFLFSSLFIFIFSFSGG